jgi:hypothetical protein
MKKVIIGFAVLVNLSFAFSAQASCFAQSSDGSGLFRAGATGYGDIALGYGRGARGAAELAFEDAEYNAKKCARKYCEEVTKRFCKNISAVEYDGARRSQGSDTYVATAYAFAKVME